MAALQHITIEPRGEADDAWTYVAEVRDDEDTHRFRVRITGTNAVTAGFGEEGPPASWIGQRVRDYAARHLTNDSPIIHQVREWPDPLYVQSDPS